MSIKNHVRGHVLLVKNFLSFKKGEVIWTDLDNGYSFYSFYKYNRASEPHFYGKEKTTNTPAQNAVPILNHFYDCATPLVGTVWRKNGYNYFYRINEIETQGSSFRYIIATIYFKDMRKTKQKFWPAGINILLNKWSCDSIG